MSKTYYWLKLKRDFFKRHDIRIIESMDNGKDYILFYMKMLVESIDHEGRLRFSESIPYDDKMLATITNTNIDIVRSAVKIFTELGMMEQFDDGTFFMSEVEKMLGFETEWAEKKRAYREQLKNADNVLKLSEPCPCGVRQEIELDKEIELELEKDKRTLRFVPPTVEEVSAYLKEKAITSIDPERFVAFYESKGWMIGKNKMKSWKSAIVTWQKNQLDRTAPQEKKYTREDYTRGFEGVM